MNFHISSTVAFLRMARWHGKWVAAILIACLMATGLTVAQSRRELPKLGVLWITDPSTAAPYLAPFKEGLRELGWIDGSNIQIVERYDAGDPARRPALAAELVALGVDLFYVSVPVLPAVRKASKTIPIVCADFYDPILEGVTTSMARPDGNVTGLSWQSVESAGKRLQLTKELIPRARRVGMMFDANDPGALIELRGVLTAARQIGIAIANVELRTVRDIEPALAKLKGAKLDALIVSGNTLTWPAIDRIVEVATANRIPVISEPEDFANAGAIITYGADVFKLYRRSAHFVDRILKGAAPKDLPFEQPTQFQLVVNLKTAKILGLQIPQTVMERATRVIR